jgi:small subunit ribosomal protein S17
MTLKGFTVICLECNDLRCPAHGHLKTHGYRLEGTVVSDKMMNTVVVERPYTIVLAKYKRSLRKNSRIHAHNPPCMSAKMGDKVIIEETRKLSKTKSFVVTEVIGRKAGSGA